MTDQGVRGQRVKMNMDEGGGQIQVVIKGVTRIKVRGHRAGCNVRGHYVKGLNRLFDDKRMLVSETFFFFNVTFYWFFKDFAYAGYA